MLAITPERKLQLARNILAHIKILNSEALQMRSDIFGQIMKSAESCLNGDIIYIVLLLCVETLPRVI